MSITGVSKNRKKKMLLVSNPISLYFISNIIFIEIISTFYTENINARLACFCGIFTGVCTTYIHALCIFNMYVVLH